MRDAFYWKIEFFEFWNFQVQLFQKVLTYLTKEVLLYQGRRNGFQSGGVMEHWKVLSTTMVDRPEQFLNSRRSRIAKTVTFWPWWQSFNRFCFESLSYFLLFPLFLFATQKSGGGLGSPAHPVSPALCFPKPLLSITYFLFRFPQ